MQQVRDRLQVSLLILRGFKQINFYFTHGFLMISWGTEVN